MTTDIHEVEAALSAARRAWGDWEGAWAMLLHRMRAAGLSTTRIDAYMVGTGYDEGGGQSLRAGSTRSRTRSRKPRKDHDDDHEEDDQRAPPL